MMVSKVMPKRLPWDNRWSQPQLQELVHPLKVHHRRSLELLMGQIESLEQVERSIVWYGPSWKWTIHYAATINGTHETLCYVVPSVENPLVCVPLSEELIDRLPLKRLTKLIRDGIRSAKYAVETHWATWTPASQKDVSLVFDLIKRKMKLELTAVESDN